MGKVFQQAGNNYTESEQVCEFLLIVPLGITHSNQLFLCKPDKNEYKNNKNNFYQATILPKILAVIDDVKRLIFTFPAISIFRTVP